MFGLRGTPDQLWLMNLPEGFGLALSRHEEATHFDPLEAKRHKKALEDRYPNLLIMMSKCMGPGLKPYSAISMALKTETDTAASPFYNVILTTPHDD